MFLRTIFNTWLLFFFAEEPGVEFAMDFSAAGLVTLESNGYVKIKNGLVTPTNKALAVYDGCTAAGIADFFGEILAPWDVAN